MNLVLGFSHHTGVRLAELGFLFILFAGVWLAAGLLFRIRYDIRAAVAGVAIVVGSVLLVIATHWGRFG